MEKPFTFAERLKELIDAKGITKSDLARTCEINKSNITRYLNGSYEAKQDVIYKIATRYNVSVSWLMGYDTPIGGEPDAELQRQHEEINAIFDRMTPELRAAALTLIKGLVPPERSQDDRGGSD